MKSLKKGFLFGAKKSEYDSSFLHDSIALLLTAFTLFILIALMTHNPHDPSWSYHANNSTGIANKGGIVGAQLAATLFYLLGFSSLFICVLIGFFILMLIRRRSLGQEWDRLFACSVLLVVCAGLASAYQRDFLGSPCPGGLCGFLFYNQLHHWFDRAGSMIFLHTLLVICFLVMTRSSLAHCVQGIRSLMRVAKDRKFLNKTYVALRTFIHYSTRPLVFLFGWYRSLFDGTVTQEVEELFKQPEPLIQSMPLQQPSQEKIAEPVSVIKPTPKKEVPSKVGSYQLPSADLLIVGKATSLDAQAQRDYESMARLLEEKLAHFGVRGNVTAIKHGPVVTLFEYAPEIDTKISKITALEDDLALALQAMSIRIIAPIPGRAVVGFEVANRHRQTVYFGDVIRSTAFVQRTAALPLVLGRDTMGNFVVTDLIRMPHLLVAGSTGSGKSVALHGMVASLLYGLTPDQLKLILVDPKRLEFSAYADVGHLLFPIVTDPKQAIPILAWVVKEMEQRYATMAACGARTVTDYNDRVASDMHLPYIVVIIDELSDLMMTAGKVIEDLIVRIAQMARAAGIHMIVATQRPSVDVITGLIKVNFPSRISFKVTAKVDSRTILDVVGADKLLGRGDMLFLDASESTLRRIHGSFISDAEIQSIAAHVKAQRAPNYQVMAVETMTDDDLAPNDQELFKEIIDFLEEVDEISISLLQRKFRVGYNRSARIIDMLEARGRIMPSDGAKMRKVIK